MGRDVEKRIKLGVLTEGVGVEYRETGPDEALRVVRLDLAYSYTPALATRPFHHLCIFCIMTAAKRATTKASASAKLESTTVSTALSCAGAARERETNDIGCTAHRALISESCERRA